MVRSAMEKKTQKTDIFNSSQISTVLKSQE